PALRQQGGGALRSRARGVRSLHQLPVPGVGRPDPRGAAPAGGGGVPLLRPGAPALVPDGLRGPGAPGAGRAPGGRRDPGLRGAPVLGRPAARVHGCGAARAGRSGAGGTDPVGPCPRTHPSLPERAAPDVGGGLPRALHGVRAPFDDGRGDRGTPRSAGRGRDHGHVAGGMRRRRTMRGTGTTKQKRRAAARSMIGAALLIAGGATALGAQQVPERGAQPFAEEGPAVTRLSIGAAVRTALDQSREVRAARLALEEAGERVSEAWSAVYPSLDFNASYTRNVSPSVNFLPAAIFDPTAGPDDYIAVQFGADNTWQSTIALEQPIFSPGAFIGVGAAGRFRTLQEEVVRGRVHEVVTQVRSSYYDLLLAQEQERLMENSVRRVRQSLEETRALNRAGLTSDYDVLRLEVELANLEPN